MIEKVLPILLALSFWQSEADATRYNADQYPTIGDMLGSLLETTPTVQTFNVDLSTTQDQQRKGRHIRPSPETGGRALKLARRVRKQGVPP